MAELTKNKMIDIVESNIERLKNKEFSVYFFVADTKGIASSSLEYIYTTAKILSDMGYKVAMLHNEKEFIGVGEWLGEEYEKLPHHNIEKENVEIGPSDFLFIPEVFSNVMIQTKKLSCKRVMIVTDYQRITETMPVSTTPDMLGIMDIVTTTNIQKDIVNDYFPDTRVHVVSPYINEMFKESETPKNLIVNIVSRNQSLISSFTKPFYWKNPMYKWVSFRDLRGFSLSEYADVMSSAAITIWMDDDTKFGYTLLEALKSGSVVLAKVPRKPADWMYDENGELTDKIVWFDDIEELIDRFPSIIRSWTMNMVPKDIYEKQKTFDSMFTKEQTVSEIEKVYIDGLFNKRLKEFEEVKKDIENNVIKTKDDD